MSSATPSPAAPPSWPVLSTIERRLLGVLVEKAKTTPDAYPLSLNSLTTGCNQKSNRDPLMNLGDDAVEEAMARMQPRGLVTRITGGRVERWRHNLYDLWKVNKVELAVLAELLLRGPQTEGELRTRASRMEPIDGLDELREVLKPLTERRLVVYLGPEKSRGTVVTHGFHAPRELEALRQHNQGRAEEPAAAPAPMAAAPRGPSPEQVATLESNYQQMKDEVTALRTQVQQLQDSLAAVRQQLQSLKESLGG